MGKGCFPDVAHFRSFKRERRDPIPGKTTGFKVFLRQQGGLPSYFRPIPIRKVSADLSREDLGFRGLTTLKCSRNSLTSSS